MTCRSERRRWLPSGTRYKPRTSSYAPPLNGPRRAWSLCSLDVLCGMQTRFWPPLGRLWLLLPYTRASADVGRQVPDRRDVDEPPERTLVREQAEANAKEEARLAKLREAARRRKEARSGKVQNGTG